MRTPLAYHITWTTYGTWLAGDTRGWVEAGTPGVQPPDLAQADAARRRMTAAAVTLSGAQRAVVEQTVRRHCNLRRWELHALNVRSNHIHLVVTAPEVKPEVVLSQLKAWCARRLSEHAGLPAGSSRNGARRWWTEHGSTKWINDEVYLENAIQYVNERQ
jgi:REP element-mobilizing transposase RayT